MQDEHRRARPLHCCGVFLLPVTPGAVLGSLCPTEAAVMGWVLCGAVLWASAALGFGDTGKAAPHAESGLSLAW